MEIKSRLLEFLKSVASDLDVQILYFACTSSTIEKRNEDLETSLLQKGSKGVLRSDITAREGLRWKFFTWEGSLHANLHNAKKAPCQNQCPSERNFHAKKESSFMLICTFS